MIKSRIKKHIEECFREGLARDWWPEDAAYTYTVEEPRYEGQGDFSTNAAMVIAGQMKKTSGAEVSPREIAEKMVGLLAQHTTLFDKIDIAGPGFINFFLKSSVWPELIPEIIKAQDNFGRAPGKNKQRVLVEFVSANPTGPLSIGHGRQAVLGDAICRLLEARGFEVDREYYYNDGGRQMRVLGESVRARYLEELGFSVRFPEDGYQGEYIRDIARLLIADKGNSLSDCQDLAPFVERAEKEIFGGIDRTLKRLGIFFDNYYNERSLYENGRIDDVVAALREKGLVYDQEGAVWFRATAFGQEKDRVIIKSSGEPTYRLPDIAYHREKFRRGYDRLIDIFGADHIATVPDVLAGVRALGCDDSLVTVILHQFVTLVREGKQVKMSTRKADFITVDEILDEVGVDVLRFFFLMRKADSQLEFDLDLATREGQENPVYYVQYGHARIKSIQRKAEEQGIDAGDIASVSLDVLNIPEEQKIIKMLAAYPSLIQEAADDLAPHRVVFYLQELAGVFHSYYNKHRVVSDDKDLSRARLWLSKALELVFRNGLTLLGMTAPESM
ncbi:MAG: arginine--tRNA ligase [Thermodesulfobacteriota bacterium]